MSDEQEEDYGQEVENTEAEEIAEQEESAEVGYSAEAPKAYYIESSITFDDIKRHIWGPIASLFINVGVVLTVCLMEDEPVVQQPKADIVVKSEEVEISEPPPEPPPPEEIVPQEETEVTEVVTTYRDTHQVMDQVVTRNDTPMAATSDAPVASANTDFGADVDMNTPLPAVTQSNSRLKLSGAFAGRSSEGRAVQLKKYAGGYGNRTEAAVRKALKWLTEVQNEDGSWGDFQDDYNQKVQLTSLAMLAFLAHGETTQSEEYGEALTKGLRRVLEWSKTRRHEGGYDENGKVKWLWNDAYAQARLAIVLAEGYAITKIPAVEQGMNRSIEVILRDQNPQGGFGWHRDQKTGAWVDHFGLDLGNRLYNAIYCAYHAGCELELTPNNDRHYVTENLEKAIKLSINAINKKHAIDKGGFSYGATNEGKGTPSLEATAAGTLFLYLMGSNSKAARLGYEWLCEFKQTGEEGSELKMDWKAPKLPDKTPSLAWYYMTQALFQGSAASQKGAKNWKKWNESMCRTLLSEQDPKGFWKCPADKYEKYEIKRIPVPGNKQGKFKEQKVRKIYNESSDGGFSDLNGRLWSTVYFTLCLEVYYRYLPTFKPDGTKTPLVIDNGKGGGEGTAAADSKKQEEVADDDISLD